MAIVSILEVKKSQRYLLWFMLWLAFSAQAQQSIAINVNASKSIGQFTPVWAWIGHDEPNYTYSDEGLKLLSQLSQLSSYPVHVRTHNLLTTGDATAALKWGSTNAFTRDTSGKPVYDWTIIDKIFDAYKATGVTPLVEIGFMPEALSSSPQPYQHHWPQSFATGWSYPPKNYDEWSELIYRWVRHMVERYGAREVATWDWEVWNEPDIFYWHGTIDEYLKLYDYAVTAVRRALPTAHVGGPASTSPSTERAAEFLRTFLQHCVTGPNVATGKKEVPLDFISFHAKGKARMVDGHSALTIANNLRDVDRGFAVIEEFPKLHHLPVLLTESDPESCAACDATSHPENGYRLTSQYASYEAELLYGTLSLAQRHHINLQGSIAWAFTFPGQPIFAGLRSFSTNNINLPLLNLFRMLGQMNGERIVAQSSGALELDEVLKSSVQDMPDVNVMATRDRHRVSVLVWNYHDDAGNTPAVKINLSMNGLPSDISKMLLKHWRVDQDHSNAYTVWQSMGSPHDPATTELQHLQTSGQLELLDSPQWISAHAGVVELTFEEPRQGVSLLDITW